MKDNSKRFKIAIVCILLGILFACCFAIATISQRIATIEESVKIANDNAVLNKPLKKQELEEIISTQLLQFKPEDGKNGKDGENGVNGKDGTDSISTNTVIQKETLIEKQLPPEKGENGIDGRTLQIGKSLDGVIVYKYDTERVWVKLPIVNITVGE